MNWWRCVRTLHYRFKVGDVKGIRVKTAIPANYVERVIRISQPGQATAVANDNRHVLAVLEQRPGHGPEVALAVWGVLEELPGVRQVALRRPDVPASLDDKSGDGVAPGRDPAVDRSARDDDVVAFACVDRAVHGLEPRLAALNVDGFVTGRVPVQVGRGIRAGERDRDIIVAGEGLPAEHQVTSGPKFLGPVVPGQQRVVLDQTGPSYGIGYRLAFEDRRRRVDVIQERGIGRKPLFAHQLLGVQA